MYRIMVQLFLQSSSRNTYQLGTLMISLYPETRRHASVLYSDTLEILNISSSRNYKPK